MPKLNNQNWIYDDDNALHARKADEVLRRAKNMRAGKKWKHKVVSYNPYTVVEVEDENGQYMYGKKRKK